MAFLTNPAIGARGVNLKDGTTVWIEPGATVEISDADISDAHDDLEASKSAPKAPKAEAEAASE